MPTDTKSPLRRPRLGRGFANPVILLIAGVLLLTGDPMVAQVRQPLVSPLATVSEEVGLTNITIKYSRPAVRDREIWGGLVPYGLSDPLPNFGDGDPFPWRAGANQTTTIKFEHDVLVENQRLSAGKYGIHMVPGESEWTVIFNEGAEWGSFFREESEDVLEVTVTPEPAPFQERLAFEFRDQNDQGALTIALHWAELRVPIRVEVADYNSTVLAAMEQNLYERAGFTWQNYATLATYSLTNNVDLDKGRIWADRAIAANSTFATESLTGRFLLREGQIEDARAFMEPLIEASTENELNQYGYQVMFMGMTEEALEVFKRNVERHPDAWNPHDSLGECYANLGDVENARKYYQMALDKLPESDEVNKNRIEQVLQGFDNASG